MESGKNYILGIYDDEDVLVHAVSQVRGKGIKIQDVYSPFPVHGLDDVLGYKRSKLPIAAFFFGLLGTSLALIMQIGMMTIDWPMIIGGKDYMAIPAFVPVAFELTVLFSALGMVAVFMVISDLKPYGKAKIYDLRSTDDKHVMAVDLANNNLSVEEIRLILSGSGASEVNDKSFE